MGCTQISGKVHVHPGTYDDGPMTPLQRALAKSGDEDMQALLQLQDEQKELERQFNAQNNSNNISRDSGFGGKGSSTPTKIVRKDWGTIK